MIALLLYHPELRYGFYISRLGYFQFTLQKIIPIFWCLFGVSRSQNVPFGGRRHGREFGLGTMGENMNGTVSLITVEGEQALLHSRTN